MKKSKVMLTVLIGCMTIVLLHCIAAFAAPAKDAKYSVDAVEIEYDMKSGDGTTSGKTTIKHDGGVAVAQGGSTFNSKSPIVIIKPTLAMAANVPIIYPPTFFEIIFKTSSLVITLSPF